MCDFFSAIVLKNGSVLHHDLTDAHSDLVAHFGLPDRSQGQDLYAATREGAT